MMFCIVFCFFFKQKTAYEMRISDWSSDVCSSDLFSHLGKTRLLHGRRDELRDPLTAPHFERLATQIGQDHLHLAAIIGVDRARRVEASDAMLQRKAGARPDLHLKANRNGNRETRRHGMARTARKSAV